jgi:hypothetical protein
MVSVYDGQVCLGFVIARGRRGYEAFDAGERSLGVFETRAPANDDEPTPIGAKATCGENPFVPPATAVPAPTTDDYPELPASPRRAPNGAATNNKGAV